MLRNRFVTIEPVTVWLRYNRNTDSNVKPKVLFTMFRKRIYAHFDNITIITYLLKSIRLRDFRFSVTEDIFNTLDKV